ncbi:MAG TPA: insulinase family protein [Puia sp.]|nr:insulinase family protein [Puia sp.]
MKKNVTAIGLLLMMGVGAMAQGAATRFHISGQLKNLQATSVYLIYFNDNKQIMDSATVIHGAYAFTGEAGEGGPAELLDVAPRNRPASADIARIYLAPESYVLHHVDSFSNAVVTGSVANTDYQAITAAAMPYEQRERALLPAFQAARVANDMATARSIEAQAKVIDKALDDSVYAVFVRRHSRSPLTFYVLRRYAKNDPDAPALRTLFVGLPSAVKGSTAGKAFAEKLAIAAKTSIGARAMDFTQNDTAGRPVSLSSFRGKYVLVDFWASWCGPCRAENPNIVNAYAKFHPKGFDIIGVSLDRPGDKDKWLKAIHMDKLDWTQVSDLGFWKNAVAVKYGVQAIPQNFLIDPQGKIIGKGLRGDELEKKLGEIFGSGAGAGPLPSGVDPSSTKATPQPLPLDPAVRMGKLPNGLTYYIRRNTEPKNRVDLYLVNKVGSVLESEDQRGLAHFMEHMSFNGTTHFPKNDLVDYLQKAGVRFGADINAYTSFDETVYQLPIPSDKPEVLGSGIQIVRDWAQDATLEPVEIDKERGVVLEEKRLGKGAGERMRRVYFPIILNNSRYAERVPIGLDTVLNHFTPATLRRFYHDWYRPDLQAVIVVGDIDVDQMERTIKEKFSDLKNPAGERVRAAYSVPLTGRDHFVAVTDKEMTATEVEVLIKHKALPVKTDADYRRSLVQELFNDMIGNRYRELALQSDPPFVKGSAGIGDFMGGLAVYDASMTARPGQLEKGVKAMWRETVRVKRFGFTPGELDRAKASYLSDMEAELKEKDKTRSESYVKEYQQHFLKGTAAPGIEKEYALVQADLPGITLAEVNALAEKYVKATDRDILLLAPEKDRAQLPDSAVVTGWLHAVGTEDLQPYKDEMSTRPLLRSQPVPGTIAAEEQDTALHLTRMTLSNGVKVVLKPTDFKNDQIIFTSFGPGGTSVYPNVDYQSAVSAAAVVAAGGVGNYNVTELEKYLAGKQVSVRPYIGERTEGVSGSATPKDLESALQLVYAYFTEPRKDEEVFKGIIGRSEAGLVNRDNDPNSVFSDTVSAILGNYNVRRTGPTLEKLHQIDLDKAFGIYKQSFADASDQTFIFVGSFDVATIGPLLEKYLGSLPATHADVSAKDLGIHIPAGRMTRIVYKGTEPKATVDLVFSGTFDYSPENRVRLDALKEALQIRLIQRLREDESGVYSPAVHVNMGKLPESRYAFIVTFSCAPENADKLVASALDEIGKLRTAGPLQENVDKWRAEDKVARETQLKTNGWWMGYLNGQLENGEDLHQLDGYDPIVNGVTPAALKAAAVNYLSGDNYIRLELLPAASQR